MIHLHGKPVVLPPDSFVAAGGEATVYAIGDVAYKVFDAPIAAGRIRALRGLRVAHAVLPLELLTDDTGAPIGHTMAFLPDAVPLSRLLSRNYCDQHGHDASARLEIVHRLAERIHAVHRAGALVVDLHEANVLLGRDGEPILIDTASWQLPGFPATAQQDAIRDRHAVQLSRATDWFAFAITAAQLLLGVHPYRGVHPSVKGLEARMTQRLSVFRPEVRLPPVCPPVDLVPAIWRAWFRDVLDGSVRSAPPHHRGGTSWIPQVDVVSLHLDTHRVARVPHPIHDAVEAGGRLVCIGIDGVYADRWISAPLDAVTVTDTGEAYGARRRDGRLEIVHLGTAKTVPVQLHAEVIRPLGQGFVAKSGGRLVQLDLRAGHALPRVLATVLPHATTLHDGIAVQSLLGATHLLLLAPARCDTRRVPELDGWNVLHAQHQRGVVAVVARRKGRTDRFVFRVGPRHLELRRTEDVPTADLDLVVLPTGVAALRVGTRIELFRPTPGHAALRTIEDPLLGTGRLVCLGDALGLVQPTGVLRLTARPAAPNGPRSPATWASGTPRGPGTSPPS